MSHDTQVASSNPHRAITAAFGEIANTIDWNHAAWQALMAKLQAAGKPVTSLTLAEVVAAIHQIHDELGYEVHG